MQVYFVLDMSASGSFGNNVTKKRRSLEVAAGLMFAALRNNDHVGIFLVTDKIEKFIPARKGKKHVLQILGFILSFRPRFRGTDLRISLIQVSKIIKKRSIVFLISDFFDKSDYLQPLKILKNTHDVIALKIVDQREQEIPDVGMIELEDEETGEQMLVNTSDPLFRENYLRVVSYDESRFMTNLRKLKIDGIKILSDENYEIPLRGFFKKRTRR